MNDSTEPGAARHLLHLAEPAAAPRLDTPGERRLDGEPRFSIWNLDRAAQDSISCGIWEVTPGKWRSVYEGKWEFCVLLSGALTLTEDGCAPVTYRAGDSFVVRDGFRGTWEAHEVTRKHYVVHLAR